MTDNEKKLLISLIMMVQQYLGGDGDEVYNSSMSAGEHAFLALEDFGLMKVLNPDVPGTGRWTEAGKSFIEEFIDGPERQPPT